MTLGEGERLEAQRRKRFWKIPGGLALIGGVGGFVSGFVAGYADGSGSQLPEWLLTAAAVALVLIAIGAAYGSYRFFVSVDEVEVVDNLWASLIGFYAYALLFPTWSLIAQLDRVPEPDQWAIFAVAVIAATAAYALRKWQAR